MTIVDGALDALDRVAAELVRFGDRVLVENPAFPGLLDLLEQLGPAVVVPLRPTQGMLPDALRRGARAVAGGAVPAAARAEPERRVDDGDAGAGARPRC